VEIEYVGDLCLSEMLFWRLSVRIYGGYSGVLSAMFNAGRCDAENDLRGERKLGFLFFG
jgi:hypothetical protein